MPNPYRNIYQTARRAAGLTQEAAAERLNVSETSLRCYETGTRVPPNDIVEGMCTVYNAQYLAYQHLVESNELARRILPELSDRPILEATVRLYNHIKNFEDCHYIERLLEIAEDGVVDDDEAIDYENIIADLRDLIRVGMELQITGGGAVHDI